jgi:hypothetical protein
MTVTSLSARSLPKLMLRSSLLKLSCLLFRAAATPDTDALLPSGLIFSVAALDSASQLDSASTMSWSWVGLAL